MGVDTELATLWRKVQDLERQLGMLAEAPRVRTTLTANLTLYVRLDGSDTNDGKANTAAGAFATIQKAVDVACRDYESGVYSLTIQVQDGTWAHATTLILGNHRISGGVILQGNTTTPSNCILRADTNGMWLVLAQWTSPAAWYIKGFRLVANTGINANLFLARFSAQVFLYNMEYGAMGTGVQIYAVEKAMVVLQTSYAIVGGGTGYHLLSDRDALIEDGGAAISCTITNTPNFSIFALAVHGTIRLPNCTFSAGALTVGVKQYESNNLAEVNGTYPGSVAGTTSGNGIKI